MVTHLVATRAKVRRLLSLAHRKQSEQDLLFAALFSLAFRQHGKSVCLLCNLGGRSYNLINVLILGTNVASFIDLL